MPHPILYAELEPGLRIAYTDSAGAESRPVVLFIHGLANYLQVWQWNILVLQNQARCIAIDLPGNGHSSRGDFDYSIAFFSRTLHRFLAHLGIKKAWLAGHSMGGQVAMQAALDDPGRVEGLFLFAPAGFEYYSPHEALLFKSAITLGNFLNTDEVHLAQSINSSFHQSSPLAQRIIDDLNKIIGANDRLRYRAMLEKCIHSMLDQPMFEALSRIQQPAQIFFGENDMLIPNRFLHPVGTRVIAERGTARMPQAELLMYPETGHFVHIERAAEVNDAVARFLSRHATQPYA